MSFNQYEPLDHEFKKLESKVEAGARFAVPQPVLEENEGIRELLERNLPVYLGAWMSRNVSLLEDCVGYPLDHAVADYDLVENLHGLQDRFSPDGYYLSLLSFKGVLGNRFSAAKAGGRTMSSCPAFRTSGQG